MALLIEAKSSVDAVRMDTARFSFRFLLLGEGARYRCSLRRSLWILPGREPRGVRYTDSASSGSRLDGFPS